MDAALKRLEEKKDVCGCKKNIYIVRLLVAVLLLLLLGRALPASAADLPKASEWYADVSGLMNYSNLGIFYQDEENFIHFCDSATGLDVLICTRVGCQHRVSDDCPAYVDGWGGFILTDGDCLLYLSNCDADVFGEQGLYEADVNGENRRQIAFFENMQNITSCVLTDECIYIAYYNQYDENMEPMDAYTAGILAYSRSSGESSVIWSETAVNARVPNLLFYEDSLWLLNLYYDVTAEEIVEYSSDEAYMEEHFHSELVRLALSGEYESLAESVGNISSSFCKDKLFYQCAADDSLYFYSVSSDANKKIGEEENLRLIPTFVDGEAYFYRLEGESGQLYRYKEPDGELELLINEAGTTIPQAVFEDFIYLYDYSDGEGILCYGDTETVSTGVYSYEAFSSTLD